MLNYSELRKTYLAIRKQQGIGIIVDANRAPRMRFKGLKWTRGAVFALAGIACLAIWGVIWVLLIKWLIN